MIEESDKAWEVIASRRYDFRARQEEIEFLQRITLHELQVCHCLPPMLSAAPLHIMHSRPLHGLLLSWPASPSRLLLVQVFYRRLLLGGRRKLAIYILGKAHAEELVVQVPPGVALVQDVQELKRKYDFYPAPASIAMATKGQADRLS